MGNIFKLVQIFFFLFNFYICNFFNGYFFNFLLTIITYLYYILIIPAFIIFFNYMSIWLRCVFLIFYLGLYKKKDGNKNIVFFGIGDFDIDPKKVQKSIQVLDTKVKKIKKLKFMDSIRFRNSLF